MNKKKIYNKPIAKVVKIDCVYLADISGYGPGGSGQGQSVPVSIETEQESSQ